MLQYTWLECLKTAHLRFENLLVNILHRVSKLHAWYLGCTIQTFQTKMPLLYYFTPSNSWQFYLLRGKSLTCALKGYYMFSLYCHVYKRHGGLPSPDKIVRPPSFKCKRICAIIAWKKPIVLRNLAQFGRMKLNN